MTAEELVPRATLVSRYAATLGSRYSLAADELIVGRAQDAGLVLDNSSVSRHHARLSWTGSTYVLEDLESTNGTWMNDRRLTDPGSLSNGDVIRFGDVPFVFSTDASATMTIISAPASSLATILFTDLESSTALRRKLGDGRMQELVRVHNEIVRAALGEHGGREIKHTGDGIMATFAAVSGALDCSIAIQRGVAAHVAEHPDSPLAVYIGLNAGEPIAEDDDLFGTSVDLAARLVDHAEPGQIIVSDVVRQLAAGKDFLFSDLGETELRGFEDPVRLWELRWRERE